jgi:hypothetical protein
MGMAIVAATVIVPIACGSDSATGPDGNPTSPVGNYSLTSVNGKPAPVTLYSDTNYLVVLSTGSLTMKSEGTYQTISTTRETVLGHLSTYVDTIDGTWLQGTGAGAIVLTDRGGHKANGTWAGPTLTFRDSTDGVVTTVVYTRK